MHVVATEMGLAAGGAAIIASAPAQLDAVACLVNVMVRPGYLGRSPWPRALCGDDAGVRSRSVTCSSSVSACGVSGTSCPSGGCRHLGFHEDGDNLAKEVRRC